MRLTRTCAWVIALISVACVLEAHGKRRVGLQQGGQVNVRHASYLVLRGGAESSLKPTHSILGRLISAFRSFVASFFDPVFGGTRAPATPTRRQEGSGTPKPRAPRRSSTTKGKTVTVNDLKQIEGGAVKAVRTEAEFTRAISSAKLVVVDFWASWCGPCQNIKPKYSAMSDRFKKATFLSVDVDAAKAIAQKYGVSSMPTFVFFRAGREIDRFSGADENRLEQLIVRFT